MFPFGISVAVIVYHLLSLSQKHLRAKSGTASQLQPQLLDHLLSLSGSGIITFTVCKEAIRADVLLLVHSLVLLHHLLLLDYFGANAIRSTVTLTSFETNPRCIFYSVYLIGVGSPVNPASGVNVISPVVGSTVHVPSFGIVRESLSPSASAITLHLVLWMQSTQPLLDQGHYLDLYHYLTVCKVLLLFLLHWFSSLIYLLLLDYFLVHNQLSGVIYMLKSCQSCCIFYICNQLSDLDHLCNPASGL